MSSRAQHVERHAPLAAVASTDGRCSLVDAHDHTGDVAAVAVLERHVVALLEPSCLGRRSEADAMHAINRLLEPISTVFGAVLSRWTLPSDPGIDVHKANVGGCRYRSLSHQRGGRLLLQVPALRQQRSGRVSWSASRSANDRARVLRTGAADPRRLFGAQY